MGITLFGMANKTASKIDAGGKVVCRPLYLNLDASGSMCWREDMELRAEDVVSAQKSIVEAVCRRLVEMGRGLTPVMVATFNEEPSYPFGKSWNTAEYLLERIKDVTWNFSGRFTAIEKAVEAAVDEIEALQSSRKDIGTGVVLTLTDGKNHEESSGLPNKLARAKVTSLSIGFNDADDKELRKISPSKVKNGKTYIRHALWTGKSMLDGTEFAALARLIVSSSSQLREQETCIAIREETGELRQMHVTGADCGFFSFGEE